MDAIANEDNRSVKIGGGLPGLILGNNLSAIGEWNRIAVGGNKGESRFVFDGVDSHERDGLKKSAVVARGLNAREGELRGNVLGGQLCAALARTTALKQIKREETDVSADLLRINSGSGGTSAFGKAGDFGNR